MHKANKQHLIWGIVLTAVSFLYWILPIRHSIVGIANAAFYIGNILIFDYLSERFGDFSLLKVRHRRQHFLVLGLVFGLLLEFYLNWIGKFWYYPYWDTAFYILVFIPGFAVYSFYLLEGYLGIKAVLEYGFLKKHIQYSFAGLKWLFVGVGLLGTALMTAGTVFILTHLESNSIREHLIINQSRTGNYGHWYWYFLIFIGIWLVLEFLEYQRHETSLLYELVKGNWWPLVALFVSGVLSAILYEIFNLPGGLWRYSYENVPFAHIQFLNFPIILYIAWPIHYLPAFGLYRLLYKKETSKLWE